jgi:hypothetical protein
MSNSFENKVCMEVEFYHSKLQDAIETLVSVLNHGSQSSSHSQIEYVKSLLTDMKSHLPDGEK